MSGLAPGTWWRSLNEDSACVDRTSWTLDPWDGSKLHTVWACHGEQATDRKDCLFSRASKTTLIERRVLPCKLTAKQASHQVRHGCAQAGGWRAWLRGELITIVTKMTGDHEA